jgi:hypothetical protein
MERSSSLFLVIAILAFFSSLSAEAFEIDSEYRSIATERGYAGLLEALQPKPIDSEYQSDILTYSDSPFLVLGSFGESKNIFSTSAGSLSATQFDFRLRAKCAQSLTEDLRFVFLRTEQENYEEQASGSFVELQYRLAQSRLWLAAYGSLARMKREDDVGLALLWRDAEGAVKREHRVYVTFPDFTRSERNDAGDRFVSNPVSFGWKFESSRDGIYRSSEVRRESDVEWRDAAAGVEYGMTMASFQRVTDKTSFRVQLDRKRVTKNTFDASGVVTAKEGLVRERSEVEWRRRLQVVSVEGGAAWVVRRWEDVLGRKLTHENLMFFMDWRPWVVAGPEFGLEATRFARHGDASLGSLTTRELAWESRLNTRYRWVFQKDDRPLAELSVALTFDLDRAEGGVFEGGHGQFHLQF